MHVLLLLPNIYPMSSSANKRCYEAHMDSDSRERISFTWEHGLHLFPE